MPALPSPTPDWRGLLRSQDLVLARGQALRSGMSEDAWQWRLDRRVWQSVLPGVAVGHSGPVSECQRAWAALLYAGPGAALSGLVALRLDGCTLDIACCDVAVPAGRRVRRQPSPSWRRRPETVPERVPVVVPHEVAALDALVSGQPGPRRTVPDAAVLHAAAWAPSDRAAETFVAVAVQQQLVDPAQARHLLLRTSRLPRRRLLLQVLDDVEQGAHARGELDLLQLLREQSLPAPDRLQMRARTDRRYYLDAWWEKQRVAVELDGAHHRDVAQWEADLLRSNDVLTSRSAVGAVVLRFTLGRLRHDRARVAQQLRAALRLPA